MADGPRPLRSDEFEQLYDLLAAAFHSPRRRDPGGSWVVNEENRANLRVIAEDGKVVTHAGMVYHSASLAGCQVKVTCVGGVATFKEYRGRGFASLAFQDCCDKAAADGVDFMLISGDRGLYTRVGCRWVGIDLDFTITPGNVARLRAAAVPVEIAPVDVEHAANLSALYSLEPVRFLRPLEEWTVVLRNKSAMARKAEYWGIFRDGALQAYVFVNTPEALQRHPLDSRRVRVVEHAGDRSLVISALPWLLDHYGAQRLTVCAQPSDSLLRQRLSGLGIDGVLTETWGTVRVINFCQLMERCRPLLAERIGEKYARELCFEMDERAGSARGGFAIRRGAETVRLEDLASLAQYIFGVPEGDPVVPEGSPELASLLARALPLPTLWYGISYA